MLARRARRGEDVETLLRVRHHHACAWNHEGMRVVRGYAFSSASVDLDTQREQTTHVSSLQFDCSRNLLVCWGRQQILFCGQKVTRKSDI